MSDLENLDRLLDDVLDEHQGGAGKTALRERCLREMRAVRRVRLGTRLSVAAILAIGAGVVCFIWTNTGEQPIKHLARCPRLPYAVRSGPLSADRIVRTRPGCVVLGREPLRPGWRVRTKADVGVVRTRDARPCFEYVTEDEMLAALSRRKPAALVGHPNGPKHLVVLE